MRQIKYDIRTGAKKIKTKTALAISGATLGFAGLVMAVAMPLAAKADTTIVVTPTNTHGWTSSSPPAETTPDATVTFQSDSTTPGGSGALQMTTSPSPSSKAQYMRADTIALNSVNELSYYTKQIAPPGLIADPSYQIQVCLNGVSTTGCSPNQFIDPLSLPPGARTPSASSFSTLVFEPYQNPTQGPIVNNVWQQWDVDQGLFWSTRTVKCSNGLIVGTFGGPATYTLAQIKSMCPEAFVVAYGVDIGSNNPSYTVRTDLFNFNGTVYDFELFMAAQNKDQCKNGGWMDVKRADGTSFKNQGDCVSYTNNGR